MILYTENPKDYQNTILLELINIFSKVARYKIHIQKSVDFCTITNCKREIKKNTSFKIASRIKYLGIN